MPKATLKIRNPIRESDYRWSVSADGRRFQVKSCPRCSKVAGQPVYHPLEDFGQRNDGGKVIVQSYCKSCRAASSKEARRAS